MMRIGVVIDRRLGGGGVISLTGAATQKFTVV